MAAARLHVSLATPDSSAPSTRGLGAWLQKAAPAAARGDVSIAVVSDRRMRALNRQFRGKDAATDVLSFPATHMPGVSSFLGDIVIASGVATRQAREAGHSVGTELKVLALHGLLHLMGYDHDTDGGKMARTEARLRKKAGLREGLIERAR
ncbi:MAG: rRNA maturation RNase YbeY [Vicinamibacterales bacterium]